MARVLAGRAELYACNVQAGWGIGVYVKNYYYQYGLSRYRYSTGAGAIAAHRMP